MFPKFIFLFTSWINTVSLSLLLVILSVLSLDALMWDVTIWTNGTNGYSSQVTINGCLPSDLNGWVFSDRLENPTVKLLQDRWCALFKSLMLWQVKLWIVFLKSMFCCTHKKLLSFISRDYMRLFVKKHTKSLTKDYFLFRFYAERKWVKV